MPRKSKGGNRWTAKKRRVDKVSSINDLVNSQVVGIIRGDYHQGDAIFPEISRGSQCTANAATACVASALKGADGWNASDVNDVLNSGDELYRRSVAGANRLQFDGQNMHYLTVSELDKVVIIFNERVEIREGLTVYGHLSVQHDADFPNLFNGITTFFEVHNCGVLTTNHLSVAVLKCNNYFLYFDSHSLSEHGFPAPDGRACIMKFDNISALYNRLVVNLGRDGDAPQINEYNLIAIHVLNRANLPANNEVNTRQIENIQIVEKNLPVYDHFQVTHENIPAAKATLATVHHLSAMDKKCQFCGAKFFHSENMLCCWKGKISLVISNSYPQLLLDLLAGRHSLAKNFKENIMKFNNLFAFASIGANVVTRSGVGLGSMYIIQGKIYHEVKDICSTDDPLYGHLYFLDAQDATATRVRNNQSCSVELIREIEGLLRDINPFAQIYMHLRDVERDERERALRLGRPMPEISLHIHQRLGGNRRYDVPQVPNEVGVVFRGANPPMQGDLRVYLRQEPAAKKYINRCSSVSEPLCYPLLFPRGEEGWYADMTYNHLNVGKRNRITRLQYVVYKGLSVRDSFNQILSAGKLTQQYIVDSYVKVESDRLGYLRYNQSDLRAHQYSGLHDYLRTTAEANNITIGRSVILPSTFVGGPRSMQQHYQDAMAIVAKFGRPDLFITFTCNPKWPEILENVNSWDEPHNRVDIICRVFHLKLRAFIADITTNKIFGGILSYVFVVEFQKRGMPHCHLLLTLSEAYKFREPHQIDAVISAEIPSEGDSLLLESVRRHMIHGPCGSLNKNAICMEDGKCKKNYPKPFQSSTSISNNSFPTYRRLDDHRVVTVKRGQDTFEIDNRYVVPYNPWLIKKYNSHINVEVCTSVKSVKYIFKYICKGHDCALLNINVSGGIYDEINEYVDSRYVSSGEACWRLLKYPIHKASHTVVRLPFHLPGQNVVYFTEGNEQEALQRSSTNVSRFECWFLLNREDASARQFLYTEIPLTYRFDLGSHRWIKRTYRIANIIPRMYTVSPKHRELFYMRLLLLHVRGATSYEDLRSVDGVLRDSFHAAARDRSLLEDDGEWDKCLREGALVKMPSELRKLFAYLLIFCNVSDPARLWADFASDFVQDFTRKGLPSDVSQVKALRIIKKIVERAGCIYDNFHLPIIHVSDEWDADEEQVDNALELQELQKVVEENKNKFNSDQLLIYEKVMNALQSQTNTNGLFFLDGPGGTGKTFVYNTILDQLFIWKLAFVSVAWTGIAAILLRGGRTVHSRFRLPLRIDENSTSSISMESTDAQELRVSSIIVWDEVTMANVHAINAVDRLLRDVMRD